MTDCRRFVRRCCVSICKMMQRRILDLASKNKCLIICLCLTCCLTFFGLASFAIVGREFVEASWRRNIFDSSADNLAGASFSKRLCAPTPIDAVYTWVNGSDPKLLLSLAEWTKRSTANSTSEETDRDGKSLKCPEDAECLETRVFVVRPRMLSLAFLDPSLVEEVFHRNETRTDNETATVIVAKEGETNAVLTAIKSYPSMANHSIDVGLLLVSGGDDDRFLSRRMTSWILISGFVRTFSSAQEIVDLLPDVSREKIKVATFHQDQECLLLKFRNSSDAKDFMKQTENVTISGRRPSISYPRLLLSAPQPRANADDTAPSRFRDNDELRFSLRSLEKNAPWIRRVFIVTNGQIPWWLNLENPRLTLVTHGDIFGKDNASEHLPTFSSPAIEMHLHRIPGLSEKFIYLNDDVFFGLPVWPDDFFTTAGGQKVFLSWPVPGCREGCPQSWIKDTYCDKPCNFSDCDWDGGDCLGNQQVHPYLGRPDPYSSHDGASLPSADHCHKGCANSWLADRYCDANCNVAECGFDAGDCGLDDVRRHGPKATRLRREVQSYFIPQGAVFATFDWSSFFPDDEHKIVEASYETERDDWIRTVSVAVQFKFIFVVFYQNRTDVSMKVNLQISEPKKNPLSETRPTVTSTTPDQLRPFHLMRDSLSADRSAVPSDLSSFSFNVSMFSDLESTQYTDSFASHLTPTATESSSNPFAQPYANFAFADLFPRRFNSSSIRPELFEAAERMGGFLNSTLPSVVVLPADVMRSARALKEDLDAGFLSRKGFRKKLAEVFGVWEKKSVGVWEILSNESQPLLDDNFVNGTTVSTGRRLLEAYADSLKHTNRILNGAYGFVPRKVPAHMPHMAQRSILSALHRRFPSEVRETSSHRFRRPDDLQFAFAYFYFLMSETSSNSSSPSFIFDALDINLDGILDDRELRVLAARVFPDPLDGRAIEEMEAMLVNCSSSLRDSPTATSFTVKYFNPSMPPVRKSLFISCAPLLARVRDHLSTESISTRWPFDVVGDDVVAFKMIDSNASVVLKKLDDVRRNPKKFVCLNDNIDHASKEAPLVRMLLQDFYLTFFPFRSQFELPLGARNRFADISEWREFEATRRRLEFLVFGFLIFLAVFAGYCFVKDGRKRSRRDGSHSDDV